MKAVVIGSDNVTTNFATVALRLRWPDAMPVVAGNGPGGVALIEKLTPDLVLLHAEHIDMSLSEVIPEVRRVTTAPLLVLGCHGKEFEVVTALTLGADDYVKLPCNITELTVRIWATFRRIGLPEAEHNGSPLRSGPLVLNLATREAFLSDQALHLTPTEFRLLRKLIENKGAVVTHRSLEATLWERDADSHGLIKKYIQRLRSKLEDDARAPSWIASIHGVGYRFVGPAPTNGHLYQPSAEPVREPLASALV